MGTYGSRVLNYFSPVRTYVSGFVRACTKIRLHLGVRRVVAGRKRRRRAKGTGVASKCGLPTGCVLRAMNPVVR